MDTQTLPRKMPPRKRAGFTINSVLTIIVATIAGAATIPTAFSTWFNASTTGWATSTRDLYILVPLFIILALVVGLVAKKYGGGKD